MTSSISFEIASPSNAGSLMFFASAMTSSFLLISGRTRAVTFSDGFMDDPEIVLDIYDTPVVVDQFSGRNVRIFAKLADLH